MWQGRCVGAAGNALADMDSATASAVAAAAAAAELEGFRESLGLPPVPPFRGAPSPVAPAEQVYSPVLKENERIVMLAAQ